MTPDALKSVVASTTSRQYLLVLECRHMLSGLDQGAQRSHPDGHRMAIHAEMALMDGQSQDEDGVAELGNS